MAFRAWLYTVAALVFAAATALTWIDQLQGLFGDNRSQYLFGPAAIPVILVTMSVALFALFDFIGWVFRTQHAIRTRVWTIAWTVAAFVLGFAVAWDWEITWLVEGDIEVSFRRDSFLPVVVGLASACGVALVSHLVLRGRARSRRPASPARP